MRPKIMHKFFLCLLFFYLFFLKIGNVYSQTKDIYINRISDFPVVDGILDDKIWENVEVADSFIQYQPYNGKKPTFETEVKIVYSDESIFIAAKMYDLSSDSIFSLLTQRDDLGQTDYFGVYFDPFNQGIISYGFFVTAAGVQTDIKLNIDTEDSNWDAVWKSDFKINEDSWTVEIQIPYSALRFPSENEQIWSVNFYRNIQRYREISTWNYIDETQSGRSGQSGKILGIENIDAPLRLSLFPYFSYYSQFEDKKFSGYQAIGGMDLKYGINESFTLDMMLIPDFGEVQSDENVLNLSAYETYYDEKRAFFTEGTEMFQKGEIFYSKRIGTTPQYYTSVENELLENETIRKNPLATQIINATKISGKTNSGLGIGFLNAMTSNTYAILEDTLNNSSRKFRTNPFTNYNVFVLDQSLKNNSYISLINTNVSIPQSKYYANVSAYDFKIAGKKNRYAIYSKAGVSNIFNPDDTLNTGFYYKVQLSKISGNFRFSALRKVLSEKYNPNDLGYLATNNQITNALSLSYTIYKPFWRILKLINSLSVTQTSLYLPYNYIGTQLYAQISITFKNHLSYGIREISEIGKTYDYFEPRIENKVFVNPPTNTIFTWISSDYRKKIAIDLNFGYYFSTDEIISLEGIWYTIAPRLRFSDKFLFVYNYSQQLDYNDFGYVYKIDEIDTVFFGKRNIRTLTNSVSAIYIFNNRSSIDFRLRHYWSTVDYTEYYTLEEDGTLKHFSRAYRYFTNSDINYNTFNIDLIYNLRFAPGSEFSLVWKNYLTTNENEIVTSYKQNLNNLYNLNNTNSLSLKIVYYMDYQYIKKNIKKLQ